MEYANALQLFSVMHLIVHLNAAYKFPQNNVTSSAMSLLSSTMCTDDGRSMIIQGDTITVETKCCLGFFMNKRHECEECELGRMGENCSEVCAQGWFGRNCSSKCFCWSEACDPIDGRCLSDTFAQRLSSTLSDLNQMQWVPFAIAFGAVISLGALISAISMFLAYHYHYSKTDMVTKKKMCNREMMQCDDRRLLINNTDKWQGDMKEVASHFAVASRYPTSQVSVRKDHSTNDSTNNARSERWAKSSDSKKTLREQNLHTSDASTSCYDGYAYKGKVQQESETIQQNSFNTANSLENHLLTVNGTDRFGTTENSSQERKVTAENQ